MDYLEVDQHLKLGGPTLSNRIQVDDVLIEHHLLSITGEVTAQPIKVGNKYFMLLGEIYNYNTNFPSDIYSVIENYDQFGNSFTEHLDGEFLVIIFDSVTRTVDFFTDPWSTRQVWHDTSNEYFYFGTFPCKEPLVNRFTRPTSGKYLNTDFDTCQRLLHNSHYQYNIDDNLLTCVNSNLHKWDLQQFKTNFDDWTTAFEQAVIKRYHNNCVLFLSSGVDSTSIALCLADHHLKYKSLNLNLNPIEDPITYQQTLDYTQNYNNSYQINKKLNGFVNERQILAGLHLEASGILPLIEYAKLMKKTVILTGHGSDETISNYIDQNPTGRPNFKIWPDDLTTIFPYLHFYGGQCRRILDKNETIALTYGIEIRNVFLDKKLAQEWLSLSPTLKNLELKSPIKKYLRDRSIKVSDIHATMHSQEIQ